jgi:hypothetical protein
MTRAWGRENVSGPRPRVAATIDSSRFHSIENPVTRGDKATRSVSHMTRN